MIVISNIIPHTISYMYMCVHTRIHDCIQRDQNPSFCNRHSVNTSRVCVCMYIHVCCHSANTNSESQICFHPNVSFLLQSYSVVISHVAHCTVSVAATHRVVENIVKHLATFSKRNQLFTTAGKEGEVIDVCEQLTSLPW